MKHHEQMKEKKPIFLLYTADFLGRRQNLIVATTFRGRLKKVCVRAIHSDLIEYLPDICADKVQQVRLFRRDFEQLPLTELSRNLRYAEITICEDGKEIA